MSALLLFFGIAWILGLLMTYGVRDVAHRVDLLDYPDEDRRIHTQPVAKIGGLAIVLAAGLVMALAFLAEIPQLRSATGQIPELKTLIWGGVAIFLIGFWDDIRNLRAGIKFGLEVLVALAVFWAGVRITSMALPEMIELSGWMSLIVTVLWIVGITNAFNLIDGSDGVAAGAALFALGTMAVIFLLTGNEIAAFTCLILAGAVLGFLFFNFPPASIFLGDSGSLFLGFVLAALGMISWQKAPTAVAVAIPVVAFGLPILDTSVTIFRRFLRMRPIYVADRGHIHHRLRDLGHSPRAVALLLYGLCGLFSLLSLAIFEGHGGPAVPVILVLGGAALVLSIQRLDIPEFKEFGRVVQRGLQHRAVISRNVRIREAVAHLEQVEDPRELLVPLRYAFGHSEFDCVEMWLPRELGRQMIRDDELAPDGVGYIWRWHTNGRQPMEAAWEVRLPFRYGKDQKIGRLSFYRPMDGSHLLVDLQLVALELLPAFEDAVSRCCDFSSGPIEPPSGEEEAKRADTRATV